MNFNTLYFYFQMLKAAVRPRRLMNALLLNLSYGLSAPGILTNWKLKPTFISIEPTNVCNLKCPECPVGMRKEQIKAVNMDIEAAVKVIDELSPTLMHVILYFQGEPLLNRKFTELVRIAHSKKLLTSTSTNAQLIDDEQAKEIVLSGLDRLIISMDGATQETYEMYRVGGKLEKVEAAVRHLVKWKKELKSASPLIEIQFIVLKTNEHQLKEMKQLAKQLQVDKLTFKTAQLYDFENGNPFLTSIKKYARYELGQNGTYHIKSPLRNRCKRLWNGAVVNSKGEILPCCFDKDSAFSFGNIKETSFQETWHNEKSLLFRKQILKNRKQVEMCRNCSEP